MSKVCLYVDYCIANEEDAKDIFGIEADNTDINTGKLDRNGYITMIFSAQSNLPLPQVV